METSSCIQKQKIDPVENGNESIEYKVKNIENNVSETEELGENFPDALYKLQNPELDNLSTNCDETNQENNDIDTDQSTSRKMSPEIVYVNNVLLQTCENIIIDPLEDNCNQNRCEVPKEKSEINAVNLSKGEINNIIDKVSANEVNEFAEVLNSESNESPRNDDLKIDTKGDADIEISKNENTAISYQESYEENLNKDIEYDIITNVKADLNENSEKLSFDVIEKVNEVSNIASEVPDTAIVKNYHEEVPKGIINKEPKEKENTNGQTMQNETSSKEPVLITISENENEVN